MTPPVSKNDHSSIAHINHVTNESHDLVNKLYEDSINSDRLKIVVYLGNNRLKISGNSSFILVDERVYQIPNFAVVILQESSPKTEKFEISALDLVRI